MSYTYCMINIKAASLAQLTLRVCVRCANNQFITFAQCTTAAAAACMNTWQEWMNPPASPPTMHSVEGWQGLLHFLGSIS